MKKSRNHTTLLICLSSWITTCGALSGCDSQSPPMHSSLPQGSPYVTAQQSPAWPFLGEQEQSAVADNLLRSNIYIVFDGSGSMEQSACSGGEPKIVAAKRALLEFVKAVPSDANLGMVAFDRTGTGERTPLGIVNYDQAADNIRAVSIGGGTPLRSAIEIAYHQLTAQAKKQLGYGEYHLVVVTDGEATSGYEPDHLLAKILNESPVIVHTIGFCIDTRHSLNQPGRTVYNTAQDYDSLRRGLQDVLAEAPEFSVAEFK